jgi:DNA-binding CsgD family transcriptional regulator
MTPIIARHLLKKFRAPRAAADAVPASDASVSPLSPREQLVLTRISQGFSYGEIADLESISRHTVHTHIKSIYSKLSVHSRTEAVFEANRLGLLGPGYSR